MQGAPIVQAQPVQAQSYAAPAAPPHMYATPQQISAAVQAQPTVLAPQYTVAPAQTQPASLFNAIDTNNDGVVSRAEFAQFMQPGATITQAQPQTYAAPPVQA